MAKIDITIGRYVISVMPLFIIGVMMIGGSAYQRTVNASDKAVDLVTQVQKENATLTKRIAATELRARDAEKRAYADNRDGKDVNVIIINPDQSSHRKGEPVHSYADLNQPL